MKSSTFETEGYDPTLSWNNENGQFKLITEAPAPADPTTGATGATSATGATAATTATTATTAPNAGDTTGQDSTTAPASIITIIYNEGGVQNTADPAYSFPAWGGAAVYIDVGQ